MVGEKAQDATSHPGDHCRVDSDQPVPGSGDRDELVVDPLVGEFPVHVIIRGFPVGPNFRMSRPRERGSRRDGAEESTTIEGPERVFHGDLQGSS
jgi:hypothetical protein